MKEGKTKRRDMIKNFAIVFLTILLLLTFFSNTIMNYSLPEVATVFVQSGNVTTRVRGQATVEASDPYNVVAGESRIITSVPVKVGEFVELGDVIYYLDAGDSAELVQAEKELHDMELNFMQRLFSGEIRSPIISRVDAGEFRTYDEFRDRLTGILNSEINAGNQVETLQRDVREKHRRLVSLGVPSGGEVALKDQLLEDVENMSRHILYTMNGILTHYANITLDSEASAMMEVRMKTHLKMLHNDGTISGEQFEASSKAYDDVLKRYTDTEEKLKKAIKTAENELILAQQALMEAEERVGKITGNRSDIIADIQAELAFNNLVAQIDAKKEEIAKIKDRSSGSAITAPVAGLITSLSHVAGERTQLDSTVAVLQIAGKGFTARFSVTNEQASRVRVGDPAEVQSGWWFNDLAVVLTGIRPDPNSPGQMRELIFSVTGSDLHAGQQLNISVGQRSATYDLVVPNSAIREDANSKFILIIEQRATPISNRYYATRVDVEIIVQDDNNAAIIAPLMGWEYVITSATRPVAPAQQVRLTN